MDERSRLRVRAEAAAAERLAVIVGGDVFRTKPLTYTRRLQDNLIPGVETSDFWADLDAGAGNELVDTPQAPAKFCAAFSSSALAVNSFGPFRHYPENLNLVGVSGFSEAMFEKPLPTGLRGTDPHLDFYAAGLNGVVCVESKFLEILWPKEAKFAESYEGAIESLAESSWSDVYQHLKAEPRQFRYLDAAQLVKHYLGMRNTLADSERMLVLVYVFWEPWNAEDNAQFVLHREEVNLLSKLVQTSEVRFVALSYRELWNDWEYSSGWTGMQQHLSNLKNRYAFSL